MRLERSGERFDEIYEIYREAFPDQERRSKKGQEAVLNHPCYTMSVKEEEGKIQAFLGVWYLPSCCFVEHLAAAASCRGKGYGRELIIELLQDIAKPVFLEIEPISNEDPMTGRRAGFYERLGFVLNKFPYMQQPLKQGDKPMPLWVMSYGQPISEEEFLPYKKEIYQTVYGVII